MLRKIKRELPSGPWLFFDTPVASNAVYNAVPNKLVGLPENSSAQYFALLADYQLTLSIKTFTEKSPAESLILRERLRRDFNTRLGPLVSKKEKSREAFLVQQTFQEMLSLVSFQSDLSPGLTPTPRDLQLLDFELETTWREMRELVELTYNEVRANRAEVAAINIFVVLLNIAGMLGGLFFAIGTVQATLDKEKLEEKADPFDNLVDVLNWIVMDDHPSLYVKKAGGTALVLATLAWGYSYSFVYLLFLEHYEPGCGPLELDDVSAKYLQLSSVREALLGRGGAVVRVRWDLENWRRDIRLGLHCLLKTSEGRQLGDTIDIFYNLASARLDFTG